MLSGSLFPRLWIAAVFLIAACAIPSRDNDFDPTHSPTARVKVIELPRGTDGKCSIETALTVNSADGLSIASRGLCLALDAGDTRDPQQLQNPSNPVELAEALEGITFDFARVTLATGEVLDELEDFPQSPGRGRFLLLTTALLLDLNSADREIRFRVEATDAGGARAQGFTSAFITNARPSVGTVPRRSVPIGGYPWSYGQALEVLFDATSSADPDGDPLTYCWKFPAGTTPVSCTTLATPSGFVCSTDPRDPCFRRIFPAATRQAVTAVSYVHDGALESSRSTQSVNVREPNVWFGSGFGVGGRVDTVRRGTPLGTTGYPAAAAFVDGTTEAVGLLLPTTSFPQRYQFSIQRWPDPTLTTPPVTVFPAGGNTGAIAAPDSPRSRIWLLGLGGFAGTGALEKWQITSDLTSSTRTPLTGSIDLAVSADLEIYPFPIPFLSVDEDGNAWASRFRSPRLFVADSGATAAPTVPITAPGRWLGGVAARPGTSETWATWVSDDATDVAHLVRYSSMGSAAEVFTLPLDAVTQIGWLHEDELWMLTVERGLLLVDVPELIRSLDLDLATRRTIVLPNNLDDDSGMSRLVVDAGTGDAIVSNLSLDRTYRVSRTGIVLDAPGAVLPSTFDDDGALWYQQHPAGGYGLTLFRGYSISADLYAPQIPYGFTNLTMGLDLATGGLKTVIADPPMLLDLAQDGTTRRLVNRLRLPTGALIHVPSATRLSFAPDGRAVWLYEAAMGIYRVDLSETNEPSICAAVLVQNATEAAGTVQIVPSVPTGDGSEFAWVVRNDGQVSKLSASGVRSQVFQLPALEITNGIFVLRADQSNGLFTAAWDGALLHLRRIRQDGTADNLGQVVYNPSGLDVFLVGLAATADATQDVFWAVTADGGAMQIFARSDSGGLDYHTHSEAAFVDQGTVLAVSNHAIWVGLLNTNIALYEFLPSEGGAFQRKTVVPFVTGNGELAQP